MRVQNLMTREVTYCAPDQPMSAAARLMWDHDCGCVPVVDRDMRPIGMITDRDICMGALAEGKALHELPIRNSMSTQLLVCHPEDSIERAEAIMKQAQVRRLPVTNHEGKLVGVLSLNDIAREAERERTASRTAVGLYDVALTLCAVSQPTMVAKAP
ncbi:MAG: CBS domain-containing protein [Polyangiaceae bacterium]|nr:CBS domain-containing protein [Polyangiaceae bacterium]